MATYRAKADGYVKAYIREGEVFEYEGKKAPSWAEPLEKAGKKTKDKGESKDSGEGASED